MAGIGFPLPRGTAILSRLSARLNTLRRVGLTGRAPAQNWKRNCSWMLRIAAAAVAAPKPPFFGNIRAELTLPSALYWLFTSVMLVGLLKVAVVLRAFS